MQICPAPPPHPNPDKLHDVSASYLAKHLQALSRAGLVHSSQGQVMRGIGTWLGAKNA